MKTHFLLPHSFKKIGWILMAMSIPLIAFGELDFLKEISIFAIYNSGFPLGGSAAESGFFRIINDDIQFEIVSLLLIVGGLFVAFARVKKEDEFIAKIRLESLVWATWAHFIVLTIMVLSVYGIDFLYIMFANMFTILVLFIIRFHFVLYKSRKSLSDEE
ncbi:MAG: hypothetical protein K9H64_06135 [Bacteroidales bacterium]|nr:hypothetical protein [Bacteroidales bacterium]MCF8455484.1 hypothetical protein [Bacteroidales bacterium]